jgi:hypothetical protein
MKQRPLLEIEIVQERVCGEGDSVIIRGLRRWREREREREREQIIVYACEKR